MLEKAALTKRQAILEAAAEVFASKGFYGAKIEDISLRAGIGKGTVYEYFRSKEDLFNELIKAGFDSFESMLLQEIDRAKDVRAKLESIIRVQIEFSQRYRLLAKIVMLENIPMDDSFRTWLRELHMRHLNIIERIVREGIEKKEIADIVDASLFAKVFYGGTSILGNPCIEQELSEQEIAGIARSSMNYYFTGIRHS